MGSDAKGIRGYFSFTRRERPGIIVLSILLVMTAALPRLFAHRVPPLAPSLQARVDSFATVTEGGGRPTDVHDRIERQDAPGGFPTVRSSSLFYFDPNTLTYAEWEALGLRERTIRVILHYREKGGRFRMPDDLGRIWGLPPKDYQRLKPYVRIPQHSGSHAIAPASSGQREFVHRDPLSDSATHTKAGGGKKDWLASFGSRAIEVNQADSLAWLALPGIGEKLASRILRFRERLGGFCSVDQVAETWGLPDSTFQLIRPRLVLQTAATRKIPLNTAPEDQLRQHPYIRFRLARVIIRYRQEHGPFNSLDDLKRIALVTDSLYAKLAPYCSLY
jgi:competence protein ComEA